MSENADHGTLGSQVLNTGEIAAKSGSGFSYCLLGISEKDRGET